MFAAALSYTIRSDARIFFEVFRRYPKAFLPPQKTPLRFKQNASTFQLKRKCV